MSPEFDYVDIQQCCAWEGKSIEVPSESDPSNTYTVAADFSENRAQENNFTCTCPAYKFKRMERYMGMKCKHIEKVEHLFCDWESEFSDETQDDEQERDHVCPRCGGHTETFKMAT